MTLGEHALDSTTETSLTKDFQVEAIEVHKTNGVADNVDLALIKVTTDERLHPHLYASIW